MNRRSAAVVVGCLIASWQGGARAKPAGEAVIRPGQEGLVSDLLDNDGKPYPADCAFDGASIDRNRVIATFTCAGKTVPLELRHPDAVGAAAARTRQFAIVSPTAPQALVDALAARLAAREAAFKWTLLETVPDAARTPTPAPPPRRLRLLIPFAILGALVLVAWVVTARLRRA